MKKSEAALIGALVGTVLEGAAGVISAITSGQADLAKRRAREASDRAVDKAFALWRLDQRKAGG